MVRDELMFNQLIRGIDVKDTSGVDVVIDYRAWLPAYNALYNDIFVANPEIDRLFIPVRIFYNAASYNATVSIMIDPYTKISRQDTPWRIFQGVSYRRTEDRYSALQGLIYACRDALCIGWDKEYRNSILVPYQRNVWGSIRVLCQVLHETDAGTLERLSFRQGTRSSIKPLW